MERDHPSDPRRSAAPDPLQCTVSTPGNTLGVSAKRRVDIAGVLPPAPRLAIIGSRAARFDRIAAVRSIAAAAQTAGYCIVSGGALGIDTAAHRAALDLGIAQVVVLPCGPDAPYPKTNIPLFREVLAAGGAVVHSRPRGSTPNRSVFASRNTLVVGLASAVAVAQVHLPSGSFGTATLALGARKPVAVLAGQPAAVALADKGATLLPFEDDGSPLQSTALAWLRGEAPAAAVWPDSLGALKAHVDGAGPRGLSIDGLAPGVLVDLLRAEALGWVGERTPGRYVALR